MKSDAVGADTDRSSRRACLLVRRVGASRASVFDAPAISVGIDRSVSVIEILLVASVVRLNKRHTAFCCTRIHVEPGLRRLSANLANCDTSGNGSVGRCGLNGIRQ